MSRKAITKQEFENRIKCIFNDKYKLIGEFKNISTSIKVVCKEHGEFSILPRNMLYKKESCKLCGYDKMAVSKSLTKQEFVKRANKKFNNCFDYSISIYINYRTKLKIICKKCGNIFEKTPNNHLKGQGCPFCNLKTKQNI